MKLRNLLNPSDFIVPMPIGANLMLQYNASGNLEKVYSGLDNNRKDVTSVFMQGFLENNTVPAHIHVMRGTTWVHGVLYTGELFNVTGPINESIYPFITKRFAENPKQFNFFADTVESTALTLTGYQSIRQCLLVAKFRILHGWAIPNAFNEEIYQSWITGDNFPFMPVAGTIAVFRGSTVNYIDMHNRQFYVGSLKNYFDENGYVKTKLISKDDNSVMHYSYSDIVKHNIHSDSLLVLNSDSQIAMCRTTSKKHYDTVLTCPKCGKKYEISFDDMTICPNDHCVSRLLPAVLQFINTMGLPMYDTDIIKKWIDDGNVTCVPDILILDEYKDVSISVTPATILRSIVPASLIPRNDVFSMFTMACSNNLQTISYYLENPILIANELGFSHPDLGRLIDWLSDGYNVSDLNTVLNSDQIAITSTEKKFDGAPIFRGKLIYITGEFIHGSLDEISSILQSYAAKVTTNFSNVVDCVLIGGKQDGINGKAVVNARSLNIPVMDEILFFQEYEIDNDLSNLTY